MSATLGRRVLRNNTLRKDAVYVITGRLENGIYTVTGMWGRWPSFEGNNKLQSKMYYTGTSVVSARRAAIDLIRSKTDKGYFHVDQFCETFPWERQQVERERRREQQIARSPAPKPFTPERRPVVVPVPPTSKKTYSDTVAGFLELYDE